MEGKWAVGYLASGSAVAVQHCGSKRKLQIEGYPDLAGGMAAWLESARSFPVPIHVLRLRDGRRWSGMVPVFNFALTAEALYTIDPMPDKKTWRVLRASLH
jgi:hypothetical protein